MSDAVLCHFKDLYGPNMSLIRKKEPKMIKNVKKAWFDYNDFHISSLFMARF